MSSFRDVIARMAVDAEFARYARANPDDVARSYNLTTAEASRLRELADAPAGTGPVALGARLSKSGIGSGGLASALAEALAEAGSEEEEPDSIIPPRSGSLIPPGSEIPAVEPGGDGQPDGDSSAGAPLQAAASLLEGLEIPPEPVQEQEPGSPIGPLKDPMEDLLKEQLGLPPSEGESGGGGGKPTMTGPSDAMIKPDFEHLVPADALAPQDSPEPSGPDATEAPGGGTGGGQPPAGPGEAAPTGPAPAPSAPAPAPSAPAPAGQSDPAPSGPAPTPAPAPAPAPAAQAAPPAPSAGAEPAAASPPTDTAPPAVALASPGAGPVAPGPAPAGPGPGGQSLLPPEAPGGGGIDPAGVAIAVGGAAIGAVAGGLAGAAAGRDRDKEPPAARPEQQ